MENKKQEIEIRNLNFKLIEKRAEGDKADAQILQGTAVVYADETNLYGNVYEIIERGALSEALKTSKTKMYWQHDQKMPMASVDSGTLELTETNSGIDFRADVSKTKWGRDAYESVKNGITDKMSFGFIVEEDEYKKKDDKFIRVIKKIKNIFDISIVSEPAYANTSVEARAKIQDLQRSGEVELENKNRKLQLEKEVYEI